ncbi:DMT family transporter [Persicirhabdus sediminis]|uniref:DMT family transporter n=1 Tax=Persicirhabdus sediminis TaxID=454144 RepID=A0A8J7SJ98_9BACT|nr:DMT family transporter [Persicirhabdus sediminis]MBK1792000.1 DMT family transporter [Persicirhabdus sediminis]
MKWVTKRSLPFVVLFCALLWGSAFPGIKGIYAVWEAAGISAGSAERLLLAGVRFSLAGTLVLLIARRPFAQLKGAPIGNLLIFASLQTAVQYFFFYWGLAVSSGVLGGLMSSSGTFWWVLLAPLMLKSAKPSWKQWLALLIGAAGVSVAVYAPGASAGSPIHGLGCFAASTLSGALAVIVLQKGVQQHMGARTATGFALLLGGLMLALAGWPAWGRFAELFSLEVWGFTFYLSMVSALAFTTWNELTTRFPVNLLAGYRFMIPLSAVCLSAFFVDGESIGWQLALGGGLVLLSIVLLQRRAS